jgi:multidrug efflux system membrane fusion protein
MKFHQIVIIRCFPFKNKCGIIAPLSRLQVRMNRVRKFLVLVSLLSVVLLVGCGGDDVPRYGSTASGEVERPQDAAAVPVTVAQADRTTIPVQLTAIGTGKAFQTVSVESQVAAIVKEVHYRQGRFVQENDLLVTLDSDPFLAAVAQAEAALSRDRAQSKLRQSELERSNQLYKEGVVSPQQYDQSQAASAAAQATVRADEAAVRTAKIQLSYCSIYAPISGVTGAQLVSPGATVKANDAPTLVVINQVEPIYVTFSVPQQYLEPIKNSMARSRLRVKATPPGSTTTETGVLTFVNNTVDTTTGTIQLMATFPNKDHRLWPGQFSNVVLNLGQQQDVLVVPAQSVQMGQQGDYVFVVKSDKTVDVRQVKVGQTVNNQTQIVQGLTPGEMVVTDGQVRLVPGTKVYFTKTL